MMRHAARAVSPVLFARLVMTSASKKSDHVIGCSGTSTRSSVRTNSRRAGRASTSQGQSRAAAKDA
jgi:hypothetical protein